MTSIIAAMQDSLLLIDSSKTSWKTYESLKGSHPQSVTFDTRNPNRVYCGTLGNVLAKQYLEKLRKEEVSIDWAHRVIINNIRQQRMLKMMAITDNRLLRYNNEIELVQFIASEIKGRVRCK